MPRVLLDHNAPKGLKAVLADHAVRTAYEMGWAELVNGKLLDAAELSGFDIMVTGDQGIPFQQRLAGRRIAVVVLSDTGWPTVRQYPELVRDAVDRAGEGAYIVVTLPRPPLRRRPVSAQDP